MKAGEVTVEKGADLSNIDCCSTQLKSQPSPNDLADRVTCPDGMDERHHAVRMWHL